MPKILVIDDDHELRGNIVEILTNAGFTVVEASSGEAALERLDAATDLVLLDLVMPGMGGMSTLALLKQRQPRLRVITITAFATIENAVDMMRLGADDYITKPFKSQELLTAIRRLLEEARFSECRTMLDADSIFNCLANPLRREILRMIATQGSMRFMDIARGLELTDHTKLNFHLKMLRDGGLIDHDENKLYILSQEGQKLICCLNTLATSFSA